MRHPILLLAAIIATVFSVSGCNLFGGIDKENGTKGTVDAALALMDQGKCGDAVTKLQALGTVSDDSVNQALGWALLCTTGATITRVGPTLFKYNKGSTNALQIVGTLANNLVPTSSGQVGAASNAVAAFKAINDPTQKAANVILADIIKAAVIMAQYSADGVKVRQSDISAGGCVGATCTTAPAACTPGMTDTDTQALVNAVTEASSNAASVSNLGVAQSLANDLNSALGNASTQGTLTLEGQAGRCAVVNNMVSTQ